MLSESLQWNTLIMKPLAKTETKVETDKELDGILVEDAVKSLSRLKGILKGIVLRRDKASVISTLKLPSKTVTIRELDFIEGEDVFYRLLTKTMKDRFTAWMKSGALGSRRAGCLEMLVRLRQACDHSYLVMNGISNTSGQLGYLHSFLQELKGTEGLLSRKMTQQQAHLATLIETSQNINPTSPPSDMVTIKSIIEGEECFLCREAVDTEDPALLPCGHSFCYSCIVSRLQDMAASHACPRCHVQVSMKRFDILRIFAF